MSNSTLTLGVFPSQSAVRVTHSLGSEMSSGAVRIAEAEQRVS